MREGGCPPQRAWLFFCHGSAGQGFSRYPFPPPLVDRHPYFVSQDGSTPLLAAVKGSHDTIVKLLLAGGADVNAATTVGPVGCGMPAAPCASRVPFPHPHTHAHTHPPCCLAAQEGVTSLYNACSRGDTAIVKVLLAAPGVRPDLALPVGCCYGAVAWPACACTHPLPIDASCLAPFADSGGLCVSCWLCFRCCHCTCLFSRCAVHASRTVPRPCWRQSRAATTPL